MEDCVLQNKNRRKVKNLKVEVEEEETEKEESGDDLDEEKLDKKLRLIKVQH